MIRASCRKRAPSVDRSPITAVIKEPSKIARRGQRADYNDVLQRVMDRTIRYGSKGGRGRGGRLNPRSIMPSSTSGGNERKDVPYCARLDLPRSHLSY